MRSSPTALLSLLLVTALRGASAYAADNGVTLYRDADFQGPSQTFAIDAPNLGLGDDSASSLRVSVGCTATLYRDAEFEGTAFSTTTDVTDLARTPVGDDSLSSLKIDCVAPRPPRREPAESPAPDRPPEPPPAPPAPSPVRPPDRLDRGEGVRIYEHRHFQGSSELFDGADDDLGDNPLGADSASSVQVAAGCEVTLYAETRFQGASVTIRRDTSDLGITPLGEDSISSLEVVCEQRRRPPPPSAPRLLLRGDGVLVYSHKHFLGRWELFTGDDPDLSDNPIGDDGVSSIRVAPGCRAVLYREPDFQGASYRAAREISDLARSPIGDDALSSIEVSCRGGRSDD